MSRRKITTLEQAREALLPLVPLGTRLHLAKGFSDLQTERSSHSSVSYDAWLYHDGGASFYEHMEAASAEQLVKRVVESLARAARARALPAPSPPPAKRTTVASAEPLRLTHGR